MRCGRNWCNGAFRLLVPQLDKLLLQWEGLHIPGCVVRDRANGPQQRQWPVALELDADGDGHDDGEEAPLETSENGHTAQACQSTITSSCTALQSVHTWYFEYTVFWMAS